MERMLKKPGSLTSVEVKEQTIRFSFILVLICSLMCKSDNNKEEDRGLLHEWKMLMLVKCGESDLSEITAAIVHTLHRNHTVPHTNTSSFHRLSLNITRLLMEISSLKVLFAQISCISYSVNYIWWGESSMMQMSAVIEETRFSAASWSCRVRVRHLCAPPLTSQLCSMNSQPLRLMITSESSRVNSTGTTRLWKWCLMSKLGICRRFCLTEFS